MGSVWLHDVGDWFEEDDISHRWYPGALTRSRSSGGFDNIWGGVGHHTGSDTTWQNDCAYMWLNATTKPIGNFHLDRLGDWTIGCCGASNTNGRGIASWHCSQGTIPIEPSTMGNRQALAVEAASNGVGQVWPRAQMDSYLRGMNCLARHLRWDPIKDINTHRGWAGTRKSDPFGPAEGYPTLGTGTWPVPAFRALVASAATPPPSGSGKYTVKSGDSWWKISQQYGISVNELVALNPPKTSSTVIHPGDVLNVPGGSAPAPGTLVMKYGGSSTANWAGWYSRDNRKSRQPVLDMGGAHHLVLNENGGQGSFDAKDLHKIADLNWSDVSWTNSIDELNHLLGPG